MALELDPVLEGTARWALQRFSPLRDASMGVDRVSGGLLTGIVAEGFRITSADGTDMVRVRRLSGHLNLIHLLRSDVSLGPIRISEPSVRMRQLPDSSWDLMSAFPADTSDEPSSTTLTIRDLRLTDGRATLRFAGGAGDSTFRAWGVGLSLNELRSGDPMQIRLDSLAAMFQPPGAADTVRTSLSFAYANRHLTLEALSLVSAVSNLSGSGTVMFPGGEGDFEDLDLSLEAKPLSFRDIHPFVQTLNPGAEVVLDISADGSDQEISAVASAEFGDGSSVSATALLTPPGTSTALYSVDAAVNGIDTRYLFAEAAGPGTRLSGSVKGSLTGASADSLSGEIRLQVTPFTYDRHSLQATDAVVRFADGNATVEASTIVNGAAFRLAGRGRPLGEVPNYDLTLAFSGLGVGNASAAATNRNLNGRLAVTGEGVQWRSAAASARLTLKESWWNDVTITGATLAAELKEKSVDLDFDAVMVERRSAGESDREDPRAGDRIIAGVGPANSPNASDANDGNEPNPADGNEPNLADGSEPNPVDGKEPNPVDGKEPNPADGKEPNPADGRVRAKGRIELQDEPSFSITDLRLENVPLTALLGDSARSQITGQLTGTGRGLEPASMSLRANGELSNSHYGSYELVSSSLALILRNGSANIDGNVILKGGEAVFGISGTPFMQEPRFNIDEASFRSVNIAELTGSSGWDTDLNGRLTGTVHLAGSQSRGTLSVLIDSSRVNRQTIRSGSLEGELAAGALTAVVDASTPQGSVSAKTSARPFDDRPVYRFTEGSFDGINLGAFMGRKGLRTALNGTFSMNVEGAGLEELSAEAVLDVRASRFNADSIHTGQFSVRADSGRFTVDTSLDVGEGHFSFEGRTDLGEAEQFEFSGSLTNIDVAALLGADSLRSSINGTFTASGSGIRDRRTTGQGRLRVSPSGYDRIDVQRLAANVTIDGKLLRVDTLEAQSNVLTLAGGGVVALSSDPDLPSSDLVIEAELVDLKPLHTILPATGRLFADGRMRVSFSGEPREVRFRADGALNRILYGDVRVGSVDMRVVGSLDPERKVSAAESRIEITQVTLPTVTAREARIEMAYADDRVSYEANATLDDRRDVRTSGFLDLAGSEHELTINSLRIRLDQVRWQMLQPSTVSFGDEYRIRNFLLYSETQQIAVDGYIDLDGEQSLILTIEQFRLGSVTDLFDYRGLDGTINGYIDLSGPAIAPNMTGSLTADIVSLNRPVGDLSLDLAYSNLRMNIDGRLRNDDGSTMTVEGYLPMNLRLASPESETGRPDEGPASTAGESMLNITSDGFAVDWILPFLDRETFSSIGGRITGRMDIRGTFSDPALSGTAVLHNGSVGLTEFGVTYRKIEGDFSFSGNQILVDHLEAASGSGTAIVTGSISLSELTLGDFDLDISSEDFLAVDNREYRAAAASELELTGSTRRPELNGSVEVVSADIYLTEEIEEFAPVTLSLEDLQTVEQRFGIRITSEDTTTFSFYNALSMNLSVRLSRNIWLRSRKSPEMDIQFTGDLDVQKSTEQDPQVFGSIEVIPERSRIVQFGKSFQITKGNLTYNGPMDDPVLDIEAKYEIRAWRNPENEVTITLTASGTFDDLEVELSSEPTMETTDIVSYIAFGRPASESLQLGGSGAGGSLATDLALGQIANMIEDLAGTGLGLDVIDIEQQGLDTRLTAGKYVHRRVYLAISQPLNLGSGSSSTGSTTPEITAEFEVFRSLLMRLLSRRSSISVNLLWQHAY